MSARQANVDILLEDLREELSIEPSPDFEHRVRRRVLDPGGERSSRLVRRADRSVVGLRRVVGLTSAAVAIAALCVVTATSWIRNASTVMPSISATTQADADVRPISVPNVSPSNPAAPFRQASGSISATSPAVSAAHKVEFEVLVPPDQAIALRRLLAAMAAGRSVVPAGTTTTDAETGELLALIGITRLPEIAPLDTREVERGRERR